MYLCACATMKWSLLKCPPFSRLTWICECGEFRVGILSSSSSFYTMHHFATTDDSVLLQWHCRSPWWVYFYLYMDVKVQIWGFYLFCLSLSVNTLFICPTYDQPALDSPVACIHRNGVQCMATAENGRLTPTACIICRFFLNQRPPTLNFV